MHLQLSPQAAAAELLRRRRARTSLAAFANAIDVPGKPLTDEAEAGDWLFQPIETTQAAHHHLLLNSLDRLIDPSQPVKQMMVFMPPGSAKSTYGSVVMPAYAMGRYPGVPIIMASYATPIALKQSRKVRAIVRQPKYRAIFDAGLVPGNESVEFWSSTNGSQYMAGGILSGMTGNRAGGLIVDDPVKGREDADSEPMRRKTREAYEDDLSTRLIPGAWTLVIQTRWHVEDLSGAILPKDWAGESGVIRGRDGQDWFVLCLPAIADRPDDPLGRAIGEPLWPEWFKGGHFDRFRRNARTWSALFQQKPTPDTGDYFESDWFRYYEQKPTGLRIYGATDSAVTDARDSEGEPDYTEHGIIGVDSEGRIFVLDWWSGQVTADKWIDAQLDLVKRWKPVQWFGESGVIRRATEPALKRRMRERSIYQAVRWLPSISDKQARARGIQGRMSAGTVYLPADSLGLQWAIDLKAQLLQFPAGRFDDKVDVMGLFGRGLDSLQDGEDEKPQKKLDDDPGTMAWLLKRTQEVKQRSKYRG